MKSLLAQIAAWNHFDAWKKRDARAWLAPASAAVHVFGILLFLHVHTGFIAPVRLPGTSSGSHLVLTYAPGRSPASQNATIRKPHYAKAKSIVPKPKTEPVNEEAKAMISPTPAQTKTDEQPGNDALGTGDVNIALLAHFPTPKPDLSQLPRGTRGDVVLDIVIDETGKIVHLSIARGVGHGVDESVIATVQQWTFHPATRNGKPVASEQELLFHYEKS